MVVFYFSGTGNTRYIAKRFSRRMNAECYSIEEHADFDFLIRKEKTVAVCYPVYGSMVPRIMREFTEKYKTALMKKKLIILCTQMMFSGDGARAFARLLPGCDRNVIYAEHINMPNNICNFFLFPITERERIRKKKNADQKVERICREVKSAKIRRRGWSRFSTLLGKSQNTGFPELEQKHRSSFKADETCIGCGLCVKRCPMGNLVLNEDGRVEQKDNCTLCYRCVNICPRRAATVMIHAKPKKQYKGPCKKS